MSADAFAAAVQDKRERRMAYVDSMPADLRELIHAYGLNVVDAFIAHGIRNPKKMRHLVETVLDAFSPTRGSHSIQGQRTALSDPVPRDSGRQPKAENRSEAEG